MRSTSPPGSTTTPSLVSSSNRIVQFCSNGVTGMIPAFSLPMLILVLGVPAIDPDEATYAPERPA